MIYFFYKVRHGGGVARAELLFTFFTLGHCFRLFIIYYNLHGVPAMISFEDKFMPNEVEDGKEDEVHLNSFLKGDKLASGSNSDGFWDLGPWLISLSSWLILKKVPEESSRRF